MTTRVFPVEVTGCNFGCRNVRNEYTKWAFCALSMREDKRLAYQENREAITESCPMFNKSFVKDEKK
jgi:hypothetical protein